MVSTAHVNVENTKYGLNILRKVIEKRKRNEKFELKWNSRGQAIGENRIIFMNYIALCTRITVDISIICWKRVPNEIKESIWTDISGIFEVPDDKKKWVLGIAGRRWNDFKNSLTTKWVHDQDGNICTNPPPAYPFINQETWDKFIDIRLSDEFKGKSEKNRECAKKNLYPYRGSRKGYAGIEEEMILASKERSKDESSLNAYPPTSIPRSLLWKKARMGKDGNMAESVKQVVDKMDSILQQAAEGEISLSGRQDILTAALGNEEHPGRVRGFGQGVTLTQCFGREPRSNVSPEFVERLYEMETQMENLKRMLAELQGSKGTEHMEPRGKFRRILSATSNYLETDPALNMETEHASNMDTELVSNMETEPAINIEMEPSSNMETEHASNMDTELVSNMETEPAINIEMEPSFPEGWTQCQLASSDPGNPIVAIGKVFNTRGMQPVMLHNKPLEPGYMRVTVIEPKGNDTPLPMPSDDAQTIFEAVGAFVAWPKNLIFLNATLLQLSSVDKGECMATQSEIHQPQVLTVAPKPQSDILKLVIRNAKVSQSSRKRNQGKSEIIQSNKSVQLATIGSTLSRPSQNDQLLSVHQQQKLTTLAMKLMYRCTRGMTQLDTIIIDIPLTVMHHEQKILITKEKLLQWLFQEDVQASHVSVYINYLFNFCQESGTLEMFGFVRPQRISPDAKNDEEKSQYIMDAMKRARKNQIFFAPFNIGGHWVLCAIQPQKGHAYWLDPAQSEVYPGIKKVVNKAIKMSFTRRKKRPFNTKWYEIKCPRQSNIADCGYCILRYMHDIIQRKLDHIPEEFYPDTPAPGAYEQHHIDETRDKWIEFVQNHMDL